MITKKYSDFIKELNEEVSLPDLDNQVDDLFYNKDLINDEEKEFLLNFNLVINELDVEPSFKKICHAFSKEDDQDQIISSALEFVGLTWQDCLDNKKLIFDNLDMYDSINGVVDILLYKLNPNYILGGVDISLENEPGEILIKYSYGYHKTKWGKIFLKQIYGGVDKFLERIKDEILLIFLDTTSIGISDMKSVVSEIKEEFNLTQIDGNRVRVYFGAFYDIIEPLIDWSSSTLVNYDPYLVDGNKEYRYDRFKLFFTLWIYETYQISVDDVEDLDEYIDIQIT